MYLNPSVVRSECAIGELCEVSRDETIVESDFVLLQSHVPISNLSLGRFKCLREVSFALRFPVFIVEFESALEGFF